MENKIAIIIPTYEEKLKHNEEISLEQCRRVLRKYDLFFVAPEGLRMDYVTDEVVKYVEPEYLLSRKKYSDYVLSLEFYEMFKEYEYILIYQLDAFVFYDDLKKFCQLEYDYVGAPWIYGMECYIEDKKRWYVGNGGFSLRKVKTFIKWLNECKEEIENAKMTLPEDMVIAIYGRKYLNIAPQDVALKFAFDLNPSQCFEKNDKTMPFGCHGWYRFENDFWKPIIDSYGYEMEKLPYIDYATNVLNNGKEQSNMMNRYFDKNSIDHCLKELIQDYSGNIYVFGAGHYGFCFSNMVADTNVIIKGFIDNDSLKVGKRINGYEIFNPSILHNNDVILVALTMPEMIVDQLIKMGKKQGKHFSTSRDLQIKMVELGKNNEKNR